VRAFFAASFVHPPFQSNSCQLIVDEIRRSCAQLGRGAWSSALPGADPAMESRL
jgi:hypothetical protein